MKLFKSKGKAVLLSLTIVGLIGCGGIDSVEEDYPVKSLGRATHLIEVPDSIGQLSVSDTGFRADIVIDDVTYPMAFSDDGSRVFYTFDEGLTRNVHTIEVKFYDLENGFLVASVSGEYDFSNGTSPISLGADEYIYDDVDADGVTTLQEIAEGRNPLVDESAMLDSDVVITAQGVLGLDPRFSNENVTSVIEFDGEIREMIRNAEFPDYSIVLRDLKRKVYSFEVRHYWEDEAGVKLLLASGVREVDYSRGNLGFQLTEESYQFVDNDGDSRSNVLELEEQTDPFYDERNLPIVSAGPDLWVLSGDLVNVLANVEYVRDEIQEIFWEVLDDGPLILTSASTAQLSFVAPNATQVLRLRVTVKDLEGGVGHGELRVNVADFGGVNVGAGPDIKVFQNRSVDLEGDFPETEIEGLDYEWSIEGNDSIEIFDAHSSVASFIAPAGNLDLIFRLRVIQNGRVIVNDTKVVSIYRDEINTPLTSPDLYSKVRLILKGLDGTTLNSDHEFTIEELESYTQIDASNYGEELKSISGIESFPNLEILNLDLNEISDLTPLRGLVSLQELSLYSNRAALVSLDGLQNLINLKVLNLNSNSIVSSELEKIKDLVLLETLSLGANNITDLGNLSELVDLSILNITNNKISSVTEISNLIKLKSLYLGINGITSLEALSKLVNLENLGVDENDLTSLDGIQKMVKLVTLRMFLNNITSFIPLTNLTSLVILSAQENNVVDLSPLSNLSNLREVSLSGNVVENLVGLGRSSSTANITILDISNNQIESLATLQGLGSSLSDLNASGNPLLSNISSLQFNEVLINVNLSNTNVSDFDTLSELSTLRFLNISDTEIVDLEGLDRLTALEQLTVDNMDISHADSNLIGQLIKLTNLSAHNCALSDVGFLSNLINVESVYLSGNSISSIEPLYGLEELKEVDLSDQNPRIACLELTGLAAAINDESIEISGFDSCEIAE